MASPNAGPSARTVARQARQQVVDRGIAATRNARDNALRGGRLRKGRTVLGFYEVVGSIRQGQLFPVCEHSGPTRAWKYIRRRNTADADGGDISDTWNESDEEEVYARENRGEIWLLANRDTPSDEDQLEGDEDAEGEDDV